MSPRECVSICKEGRLILSTLSAYCLQVDIKLRKQFCMVIPYDEEEDVYIRNCFAWLTYYMDKMQTDLMESGCLLQSHMGWARSGNRGEGKHKLSSGGIATIHCCSIQKSGSVGVPGPKGMNNNRRWVGGCMHACRIHACARCMYACRLARWVQCKEFHAQGSW